MSFGKYIISILFVCLFCFFGLINIFSSDEKSIDLNIGGGSYIFIREQIQQLYCQTHATKTTFYPMMSFTQLTCTSL